MLRKSATTRHANNSQALKQPRPIGYSRRRAAMHLVMILVLIVGMFQGFVPGTSQVEDVSAHNLQTRMVSMYLDAATQAFLDARMASPTWNPPDPLLQAGDELGLVIKVIPRDGTTTGVGGHVDFYIPNGVQVIDVGYLAPDGSGGFVKTAMKGQSPIAIGAGPVGASTTTQLAGMPTTYTNVLNVTEAPVTSTGLHRGTIAGVYSDTGIFFSTDPDTAYGSWQAFTGDSTANGCGSLAYNPLVTGKTLVNNSGDTVVPCNKWDAEQLMAFGVKGGTYGASAPIVDYGDGRGNAPWGFAAATGGPQSGYAWNFDWDEWQASAKDAAAMQNAMGNDEVGPWQRIQYNGDRVAYDQAGSLSTVLGYASIDAGNLGIAPTALGPTTSQTDTTSPKVIRFAVGQLTTFRPEYAWIKIRVLTAAAEINQPNSCAIFKGDTFGGDAGGTDNGKDHVWRYYEPTEVTWNACMAAQKPNSTEFVKVGDIFQYDVDVYNLQAFNLTNVKVTDFLPSGVTFISAVPAQTSGPNPLVWNVGTLLPGQKFSAKVTVRATSTGYLDNKMTVTSDQVVTETKETTISGLYPYLVPSKTARSTSVAPGGTVIYDLLVRNVGTGPTGSPVTIREFLPTGFTYDPTYPPVAYANGALITATVNSTNLNQPVFTIPTSIQGAKSLTIAFRTNVSATLTPGPYCNTYSVTQNAVPITTGSEGCVSVAGGKIGDLIWRDWDGDGMQDTGEEGIAGVTVQLYAADGTTLLATTTTNANGNYYFNGLEAGTYVVKVNNGMALTGTTQTGDPDASKDNTTTVTLATDQQWLTADFGYRPTGTSSIGDKVFEDVGNDGLFTSGTDTGIANVTVWLYEDTNGDGIISPGMDALVAETATNATGDYSFPDLANGFNYLVEVDKSDADIQTYFNNIYDPDPVSFKLSTLEVISSPNLSGSDLDNDFGFWKVDPSSIGDQVFLDVNKNGTYDTGDSPLSGMTVTLSRDGVVVATATTGADGKYLFPNLGPGNYTVAVDTTDPDLPGGLFSTTVQYAVTLAAGDNYLTADFPFVSGLAKTVDKPYAVAGEVLTFTIRPYYPGGELLTNVRVIDPIPTGTTYVASSATAGGTYGLYVPVPAVPGQDTAGGPAGTTTLDSAIATTPSYLLVGNTVNVVLTVKQNSGASVASVSPTPLDIVGGTATCTAPTPASASVPTGATGATFSWTCTLATVGEFTFSAGAQNTDGTFVWPSADSASVLSSPVSGTNVVTWNLGSNVPGVPGETLTSGYNAGVYAFRGGNKKEFSKYDPASNTWVAKAQPTNGIEKGGSLTVDPSTGTIYASEGNAKIFYKYDILANTWTQLATTTINFNEGGATQFMTVGGVKYVYALLGNSNLFQRYNVSTNTWTALAVTPAAVKKGGALTTDGTYLYALQGDTKTGFYRYNIATNSWTTLAPTPGPVGWGGSLVRIGNYLYATQGNGKTGFWRYNITANTWSAMAVTPGVVKDGGSLTTDGTNIYALQGRTMAFWTYSVATNKWSALPSPNFLGNVDQGGALVYVPANDPKGYYTTLVATPSLVSTGDTIKVTFTLRSNTLVTAVTPGTLTVTPTNGASTTCTSALKTDNTIANIDDPVIVEYTCPATAGTNPGSLRFSNNATGTITTGTGSVTFPTALSKTVLVSPVLTYSATVNTGAPVVINNTAIMAEKSGTFGSITSNTTETATTASIGDYVWADVNGDGFQVGESGLSGVRVYIDANGNGAWDVGELYDITDSSGAYRIYNLGAGTYSVRTDPLTYPAGYIPTTAPALTVTLAAGQQYSTADYGLKPAGTGQIGDYLWLDANSNGVQDPTESPLPNISVKLEKFVGGMWIPIATTTTSATGSYLFSGLIAGDYRVTVDATSPVTSPYGGTAQLGTATSPTFDKDNGTASDSIPGSPDSQTPVTLVADTTVVTDVDFGYNWAGTIGDYVWWDDNTNGLQDTGELPISNAVVLLYIDANGDGLLDPYADVQVGFTRTDSNGMYSFQNLPAGKYLVDVYEDSVTTDGVRNIVPTTSNLYPVTLPSGGSVLSADFGYYVGARVDGNVFHDADRNTYFEPGETGLTGITVTLTGTDMFGVPVSRTTTTDASGHFTFLVPEGDYTVSYNTSQTAMAGFPDATNATSLTFHASPGEDWHPVLDFGVDNSGSLGDRLWNDANNNGVQDAGEVGLPNVTVNLYSADGTTWLGATVTDGMGMYLFPGLPDGTYLVKVDTTTLPAGYTNTYDEDNGTATDGIAGNPNDQTLATVSGGTAHLTADFGYLNTTSYPISGNVFNDMGTIGTKQDSTIDPGLAGITVYLYDGAGNLLATAVTDSSGNYTFPGMPNGTYTIKVDTATLPSTMYDQTYESDTSIDNSISVTVSGGPKINNDFGFHAYPGSISGTVCSQADGDGQCESGEAMLAGVTITLVYAGKDGIIGTADDTTFTTTTNASGDYSFTDLNPGLYQVIETNLPNLTSLADADGGNPDSITVNLARGQDVNNQDFEDYGGVDLAITKTDGATTADKNSQVTYTITVTNLGILPAQGVAIHDTPATGLTYLSSTCGTPTISGTTDNPTYTWTLGTGTLAAGASSSCTITVRVGNLNEGTQVTNYVNVTTTSQEPNITNNEASDTDLVTAQKFPNLKLTKTDGTVQVLAGERLSYTITYSNTGDAHALGVVLTDTLSNDVTYVSSTPAATVSGSTLTWNLGQVNFGASSSVTVVVDVKTNLLMGAVILNRASITSTNADFDLSDNTASDTDTIVAPYIVLEKSVSGSAFVGGELTYTIQYTNNSAATSYDTTITDVIPTGTSLVTGSISDGGTETDGTLTWNLGTLAPNATGTVSFKVTLQSGITGVPQTTATLSTETGSGSVTVTSKTSSYTSLPWCDDDYNPKCLTYRGLYPDPNTGLGPVGWNDNPRGGTAFDDSTWAQPAAASTAESSYWLIPSTLNAEWTSVNTADMTSPNYSFFRQAFCLPLNATGRTATLSLAGDDVSDIYLNGVYLGQQIGAGAYATFNANAGVQAGINILSVRLLNNTHNGHPALTPPNTDHSGLLFNLQASYGSLRPFAYAPTMILSGQEVTFTVDQNALSGRTPFNFMVDFGDGTTTAYQTSNIFTHTYATSGRYTATVTARAQYGCTGSDQITITVLPTGAPYTSQILSNKANVTYANANAVPYTGTSGAGIQLDMGTVTGFVYNDVNGDGVYTEGIDTPAENVTVVVTDQYGTLHTVTTGSDGYYTATEIPSGMVTVDLLNPPPGTQTQGGDPTQVQVYAGLVTFEENNGFSSLSSLSGRLWVDEDSNGLVDAGEPGIANVMVTATLGSMTYTTWTDSDGNYAFPSLPAGDYSVTVGTNTLDDRLEVNATYDTNGTGTLHTTLATLVTGTDTSNVDFGYNWAATSNVNDNIGTGAIGDRVWIDADGDGLQDLGELGLGGVPVALYADLNYDGIYTDLVASTTTDAAGNYIFDGLLAGSYVVRVNNGSSPAGYTQTGDPDSLGAACATCDNSTTSPILLSPGDVYLNADFGYKPQEGYGATIGDRVWLDVNGNGSDDEEPGIPGLTVALIRDLNGNGVWDAGEPIIATTLTDVSGAYAFTGVPVTDGVGTDDYLVWVNNTSLVIDTLVPSYDANGISTPNISAVPDLTPDGNLVQDFGYKPFGQDPSIEAVIGDTVFLDRNNSNSFDLGEGLEGIKVTLYQGTNVVATTYTNENGFYLFGNLPAGSYTVKVDTTTLPLDLSNSYDPDGGLNSESIISVVAGAVNLAQDFGYQGTNTLSGTIWNDLNADGLLASETGLAGVTVALYDANGNLVGTTKTDSSGNYSFANLPNGAYTVDVTDENNVLNGYWHSLGTPNTDLNSQTDLLTVSLTGGTTISYADFGYYVKPASVGNFVFYDVDGDGIQDAGEPGIPGVPVTLTATYPNGEIARITIKTDANGFYSFQNLLLDEDFDGRGDMGTGGTEPAYILTVTVDTSDLNSPVHVGTDNTIDSGDSMLGELAHITMGGNDPTVDFGFYRVDWGDAKDTYLTTATVNGPRNILFPDTNADGLPNTFNGAPAIWLGPSIDYESNAIATLDATGDGVDEDGITLNNPTEWFEGTAGGTIDARFSSSETTSKTAWLAIWFDWNNNGIFDESEKSVNTQVTFAGPLSAAQTLTFDIPIGALGSEGTLAYRARLFDTPTDPGTGSQVGLRSNGEVEDYTVPYSSLPVTMTYFYATTKGSTLLVDWSTGTEMGNIGFNLYIETKQGLKKINEEIIPATGITTHDPQDYHVEIKVPGLTKHTVFYLEDVDIIGRTKLHGPFELEQVNGKRVVADQTNWQEIQAEAIALEGKQDQANVDSVNQSLIQQAVPVEKQAPSRKTKTPTPTKTTVPTNTPTATYTPTPTATYTPTPTSTFTPTPTFTHTPTPTATETPIPTPTETPTPLPTDVPQPTPTEVVPPTDTPEPTPTDTLPPTETPTPEPTATDTPEPTPTDTLPPSETPTAEPTVAPTEPPIAAGLRVGDLLVSQAGIYRVTYEDLLAAGLDLNGQLAANIALTLAGQPVAIFVSSPETFGAGSFFEFQGTPADSQYTSNNVYTLWVDQAKALRVAIDTTAPAGSDPAPFYMETARVDKNVAYDALSTTGDPWYNARMVVYTAARSWNFPLPVDHYQAGAAPATLRVNMYGGINISGSPDHHVVLKANSITLADRQFDGLNSEIFDLELPVGALLEGNNVVTIGLPADTGQYADIVYLDQYQVTYPRAFWALNGSLRFESSAALFQVDNLLNSNVSVYRLQDGLLTQLSYVEVTAQGATFRARFAGNGQPATYFVVNHTAMLKPAIRAARPTTDITSGAAEYLVIAHPNFIPGLTPLVQARQAQGLTVKVVDVMDIYDQFSFGLVDPQAIKSYIGFAAQQLGTQYVLLVGDDTYDYKNYLNKGAISFIPSIYMATGDLVQYAPVDPKYVDLDNDNIPDLSLGRFPVRTIAELANLVSKTLSYATKTYDRTAVFAADWTFAEESDALAARLPSNWALTRAYLDTVGVAAAQNTLMTGINAGVALTSYVGHSDDWEWTWDGLFSIYEGVQLTNFGKPTIVTQNGCWNIYYVNSQYETLGDVMLNRSTYGAAAMFGSTTLTSDLNEQKLGDFFMPLLTQPGKTLGQAMLEAKRALGTVDRAALDVLMGWSLLGDPYLRVNP